MKPLISSLSKALAASAASAVLLLPSFASAAQCLPARVPPSPEYLSLVARYASDEPAEAVRALGAWNNDRLRCDLDNLQAAALAVSRCRGECEDRPVFERFSLRAALLLHAEREIASEFGSPVSEQLVHCRTGPQSQVIDRLAGMLLLVDPEAKAFLSRFYVSMARRAQWSHCIPQAEQWARMGLKRLPRDGALLLTLGTVLETTAFLTLVPAPRPAIQGSQAIRRFEAQTARLNGQWAEVRRTFEQAVAEGPGLHEAKLRLGRVLWRLNRPEPARARFDEVLAQSNDPVLLYLAHLFIGRIHEDQNRLGEAENEYQTALALRPLSEAAPAALSHVLLLTGDPEGAREALAAGLERMGPGVEIDPYKVYAMAHTEEGQAALDEMRKALRR